MFASISKHSSLAYELVCVEKIINLSENHIYDHLPDHLRAKYSIEINAVFKIMDI